ncbi:MAG: hypothetical protein ACLSA2_09235 [Candidatus Gastranaerophilaceae bacterium]
MMKKQLERSVKIIKMLSKAYPKTTDVCIKALCTMATSAIMSSEGFGLMLFRR